MAKASAGIETIELCVKAASPTKALDRAFIDAMSIGSNNDRRRLR